MTSRNQYTLNPASRHDRHWRSQLAAMLLPASLLLSPALHAKNGDGFVPADQYLNNIFNYSFKHTRGILDSPYKLKSMEGKEDPDSWEYITDAEKQTLVDNGININFPNFNFITSEDSEYPLAEGEIRQKTHSVEHILYAMPGDVIPLYPYYGLSTYPNFKETFAHWYDYTHGGRVTLSANGKVYDLLDFPGGRQNIQITESDGFMGGRYLNPGSRTIAPDPIHISTVQEFIDVVNSVNDHDRGANIELDADLDFEGRSDIPMLGYNWDHKFHGIFNGNGHKLSNLIYDSDDSGKGFIGCTGDNAVVMNLVIDNSCSFSGRNEVGGVVGFHAPDVNNGGSLTLRNIRTEATVYAKEGNDKKAAGLIGACNEPAALIIENCYVGGTVGMTTDVNCNNAAIIGWWGNLNQYRNSSVTLKNVVINCSLYGKDTGEGRTYIRHDRAGDAVSITDGSARKGEFSFINCYGSLGEENGCYAPMADYSSIEGWKDSKTPSIATLRMNYGGELLNNVNNGVDRRNDVTSAVFFCPVNADDPDAPLPFRSGEKEYVIAADFSQTFQLQNHLDVEGMTVIEPVIAFRHIFRIRDGRTFADNFSGSVEKNRAYIRKNQKMVSARANKAFQFRLPSPLPDEFDRGGRTAYYYRASGGSYNRVRHYRMRVLDGDTRKPFDNAEGWNQQGFYLGAGVDVRNDRNFNGHDYASENGTFPANLMLMHDNPAESHYIVQILGTDDDNRLITIPGEGGTSDYLVLMEFNLTFLPEEGASLLSQESLYAEENDKRFGHARDASMKEKYGDPIQKIDFDEYIKVNHLVGHDDLKAKLISYSKYKVLDADNPVYDGKTVTTSNGMHKSFFKWPVRWAQSDYSFGYNYRHDYNMYMLTTHTDNVPFHVAADGWNGNMPNDGIGLYDRLYYKTKLQHDLDISKGIPEAEATPVEQGYFYYVNAASDPGVSARLDFRIPCPGSRIVVSAWVAECSPFVNPGDETSNISFNFVAVLNGSGDRVVLHNFITGYIPNDETGKWMNVYYSFIPRLSEFYNEEINFNDVDHFELELAHNGKSSSGADYAIDDIRAYVVPPTAETDQLSFACDNEDIRLKIGASFETLLEKIGKAEAFSEDDDSEVKLFYTFIDKDRYDDIIKTDPEKIREAFDATVVVDDYNNPGEIHSYGMIGFSNFFRLNPLYKAKQADGSEAEVTVGKAYREIDIEGDRMIVFESAIPPAKLRPGKEYYIIFKSAVADTETPESDPALFFNPYEECSYQCVAVITPLNTVKVNGVIQEERDRIMVCENQSPVIQVNIWGRDPETGEVKEVEKNARLDWFYGTLEEFEAFADQTDPALTLQEALEVFRERYPHAESISGIKADESPIAGQERLEQWMLDIIARATTPTESHPLPALTLYRSSFVLPPVDLPEGVAETSAHAVALPIPDNGPDKEFILCTSPTEIDVTVGNSTPLLRHGLPSMEYPEAMTDVPLRIGLEQLRNDNGSSFTMKRLVMPVREVSSSRQSDSDAVELKILKEGFVTLVQTNDPEYKDLGTIDQNGEEVESLLWVGEIKQLQAVSPNLSGDRSNRFEVEFKDDFNFKEGFYYRMRFKFEEKFEAVDPSVTVCSGEDVFTLKIVPKYLLWTGAEGLSWNNDANWSRLDQEEIFSDKKENAHRHFVTDGLNSRKTAYAPLDFSKAIVGNLAEAPYLLAPSSTTVKDFYDTALSWEWTRDPVASDDDADRYPDFPGNVHLLRTTPLIQYDMAAFYPESLNNGKTMTTAAETSLMTAGCRPWYANTCGEIHFKPGGSIMNQQCLYYGKAWVDVELDPSRWYTLSLPLQEVFAGDLYLPSKDARQSTELFNDITFDNNLKLNNRFKPAVYQRGWDKSVARVYELENPTGAPRNVAVRTFWSHVYNDVEERYGAGTGFSIKTDISRLYEDREDNGRVLFRLPKADEKFLYFNQDGTESGHETEITRSEAQYKLNDAEGVIKASTKEAGKYFLVGNPFMTHLDIRSFLEANKDKVEPKYWIVTVNGQQAVVFTEDGGSATASGATEEEDLSVVPPMQGFFVEAKDPSNEISLDYKPSMMRRYDSASGERLTQSTRSASGNTLLVTSTCAGRPSSAALVVSDEEWVPDAAALDNRDLDVPSLVYTVKNGRALSINSATSLAMMEIGVVADPGTESVIRFSGEMASDGLYLLDKMEDRLIPLHDGLELRVKGSVSGRWFLTSSASREELTGGVEWTATDGELTVVDRLATGSLDVKVYDLPGRVIAHLSATTESVTIPLQSGTYLLEVTTGTTHITEKIRL